MPLCHSLATPPTFPFHQKSYLNPLLPPPPSNQRSHTATTLLESACNTSHNVSYHYHHVFRQVHVVRIQHFDLALAAIHITE